MKENIFSVPGVCSQTIHVWYNFPTFTIKNLPNVGKYTIHGWYGIGFFRRISLRSLVSDAHQGGSSSVPVVQPGPVLKVRRAGERTGNDLTT